MPSTPTDQAGALAPWQLPFAQLCDSAAPTGGFAHSFGMETYVAEGSIETPEQFEQWLATLLRTQLAHADALAIRLVAEAAEQDDLARVWEIDRMLHAQALARQVREANRAMGERTLVMARMAAPAPALDEYAAAIGRADAHGHPAVVLALAAAGLGAPVPVVVAAHLQAQVVTLTQNAVRLVPLGQNAGQGVIARLAPVVAEVAGRVQLLPEDDFGATTVGVEIAQMRHEQLRARMYMS